MIYRSYSRLQVTVNNKFTLADDFSNITANTLDPFSVEVIYPPASDGKLLCPLKNVLLQHQGFDKFTGFTAPSLFHRNIPVNLLPDICFIDRIFQRINKQTENFFF